MNEIYEVNGKQYSVKPEDVERFLQNYPYAKRVVLEPDAFGLQTALQDQESFEEAQDQITQANYVMPGTGKVRKTKKELTWFDQSWFGRAFNQASSVGESLDLFQEGSDISMETVKAFVNAEYENAANYVESERMKAFNKKYKENGGTWTAFFGAVADDLTILPELFVSSLGTQIGTLWDSDEAQILGGTAFLGGAVKGRRGGLYGSIGTGLYTSMAAISASMETGLTFTELIKEELGDKEFNEKNVYDLLSGPRGNDIRNKAIGRGLSIAAFELAAGYAAGKVTTSVLRSGSGIGTTFLAAGAGVGVEAIGGGLGEIAGMTAAGQDYDPAEIGFEAITGTVTAPMTVGTALLKHKEAKYILNKREVSYKDMKKFVETADDLDVAKASISMINDRTGLEAKAFEKQNNAIIDSQIDKKVTDIEDRMEIVSLEKERRRLKRNKKADDAFQEAGVDDKLALVEGKIKAIINKYKGAQQLSTKTEAYKKLGKTIIKNRVSESIEFAKIQGEAIGKTVKVVKDDAAAQKAADAMGYNVDVKGKDGFIYGDVIVINKDISNKTGAISVGSHELLHGIIYKHIDGLSTQEQQKLGESFLNVLNEGQKEAVLNRLKDSYNLDTNNLYKDAATTRQAVQEMFTAFSDAIEKREITFDETTFDKIKNILNQVLRVFTRGAFNKEFRNGRAAYNFLKEYNRNVQENKLGKRAIALGQTKVDSEGSGLASMSQEARDQIKETVDEIGATYSFEGGKDLWNKAGADNAVKEIVQNGYFNDLIASKFKGDVVPPNFVKEVMTELSRHIKNFNPEVNDSLFGWINSQVANKANKVYNENYKDKKLSEATPIEERTKEGDVKLQIEADQDTEMKRIEEEDMSIEGQRKKKAEAEKAKQKKYSKFRRKLGIEKDTELYNKILESSKKALLRAYEKGTAVRNIQRKLRDEANVYLFKDIKNFLGTTQYINNLKEYRTYIVDAIFTSDLVQLEKMLPEDQRVFTEFVKELTSKAEVQAAVDQNLLPKEALNVIDKGNSVRLYKKVMPTEKQFIAFFDQPAINPETGKRSGLKGTRKDALAKAMAGALSYDATLQIAQDPEVAQQRQDLAELKGESLDVDDIDQLAAAIGRDKGILFSSSPKVVSAMAIEIKNTIEAEKAGIRTIVELDDGTYDLLDKNTKPEFRKTPFSSADRKIIASLSQNIINSNFYGEITNSQLLAQAIEKVVKAKRKGKKLKIGNAFEQLVIDMVRSSIAANKSKLKSTKSSRSKDKGDLYISFLKNVLGIEVKMHKARGPSKTASFNKNGEVVYTQENNIDNFDEQIAGKIKEQVKALNKFLKANIANQNYKLTQEQVDKVLAEKYNFGVKGINVTPEFLGFAYANGRYKNAPQGLIQIGQKLYRLETGNQAIDGLTSMIAAELNIENLKLTDTGKIPVVGLIDFSSKGNLKFRVYSLIEDKNFIDTDANLLRKDFTKDFVKTSEKIMSRGDSRQSIEDMGLGSQTSKTNKGITILDFDDTLATTKSMIRFTKPDGTKGKLNAEEYASTYEDLLGLGYEFDFSEFSKVVGGKTAPLFNKALKLQKKFGNEQMYVLTARPADSAQAIHEFLKANGLNIPIKNITGLGNSTSEAKALWVADKVAEGFNDFYFADDAIQNVQAVDNILEQFDVKRKVQQAKGLFSKSMDKKFNQILDDVTGINAKAKISRTAAQRMGAGKGRFRFFVPPSHEDFIGMLYNFMGKGKLGDSHRAFFEKALLRPLNKAYIELNTMRQSIARDFKTLNQEMFDVKSMLTEKIGDTGYTYEDAVRVYLWKKHKHKIPGMSKEEINELSRVVRSDSRLRAYAENINVISKQKQYVAPTESWTSGDIRTDLADATDRVGRSKIFNQFLENADIIFSEKNLNKIEAAFGESLRKAIEDSLYRTKTGRNKPSGQSFGLVNRFMNYINGSVGAVMFFNMRSALLQQMSMVNYLNFSDNNIFKAAAAFSNIDQYFEDFAMIFNSDFMKQRRGGIKTDVNGAELAASLRGAKNTPRALIAKLLELGFLPTQIGDNIAIAIGGSTFYRNRVNTYISQGLSLKEAETKAFEDFQAKTEATQQSARPDMVSQQQASPLGKIVLAFQNVTSQFNRIGKKAFLDIKNRRISPGNSSLVQSDIENVTKIAYYLAVQNVIFYSLQTALFAMMFDDDANDEKMLKKTEYVINGSIDSILRGSGLAGAVVATLKNTVIKYIEQRDKTYNPDESAVLLELLNIAVPVGIKSRKITNAEKTLNYNKDVIEEMSIFDIDNPIWSARTTQIEAVTNIPLNRLYNKVRNVRDALNNEFTAMQRVMLFLGWSRYNLGIEDTKIKEVKENVKERKKEEKKKEKKNKPKQFKEKKFKKIGF